MNVVAVAQDILRIRSYHRSLAALPVGVQWETIVFGEHHRQRGLLALQPEAPAAPLAVWIHGGGWQFGNPALLEAFGDYFYARGYHVWMPSHRRLFRYRGCDIVDDLAAGFGELASRLPGRHDHGRLKSRGQASRWPVLLGGMSSGGQLATLLALRPGLWAGDAFATAGLIACGAPLSLAHIGSSPTRRRLAGAARSQRWCDIDALHNLERAPDFPAVLLHGTADGLVPFESGLAFASKARSIGWDSLRFVPLPGGDHLSAARWIFE